MLIYKITNRINNKCYIGQTTHTLCYRFCNKFIGHYTFAYDFLNEKPLYRAYRKYGKENFDIEILENNINDKDILNSREEYWTDYYNSLSPVGYNLIKGKYVCLSEETKQKISNSLKGKFHSIETKQKISKSNKGKKRTLQQKLNQSKIRKLLGQKPPSRKGIKLTTEIKNKISLNNSNKKKVINLDTNKIFESTQKAAEFYNIKYRHHIGEVCNGKRKKCGGYRWCFV